MTTCSYCKFRSACVSVCLIVSTLGVSPRRQKCSKAVWLCNSCLQQSNDSIALLLSPILQKVCGGLYTAFTKTPISTQEDKTSQPHAESLGEYIQNAGEGVTGK